MNRPLRTLHRRVFFLLASLIPILFAVALAVRAVPQ